MGSPTKVNWVNEKIIHTRSMRDFLLSRGGILKKTKTDLCNPSREIYIFNESSVADHIGDYPGAPKGGQVNAN